MYRAGSGFDEHHVLPYERGEVERRHERDEAWDAAQQRADEHAADHADVRNRRDPPAELRGAITQ